MLIEGSAGERFGTVICSRRAGAFLLRTSRYDSALRLPVHHHPHPYRIQNGPRLDLHLRDGALCSNDWVMLPTADGALFSPRDYGTVRGVEGSDGRFARLDWTQGGETYQAPRVVDGGR